MTITITHNEMLRRALSGIIDNAMDEMGDRGLNDISEAISLKGNALIENFSFLHEAMARAEALIAPLPDYHLEDEDALMEMEFELAAQIWEEDEEPPQCCRIAINTLTDLVLGYQQEVYISFEN